MRPGRFRLDSLAAAIAAGHAGRQYARFMRAARDAARTQERVLLATIARNTDSDFGRAHGFSDIGGYADFAARVGIHTYEDLRPHIKRVMDGDTRALFGEGQPVLMFAITSGSTDEPKYVPVTPAFLKEYRRGWNVFGIKALLDHRGAFLRSILQVVSPMDEHRTEQGVPCGSISGLLADTQKRLVRKYYTTPPLVASIADPDARYYTVMRFGAPRDVAFMITASPATQLKLVRSAADHAERLIRDVRDGTLNPPGDIDAGVRRGLTEMIRPDHEAARRLTDRACAHGELLPKHYWNLAFLANWTGGTMGLHLRDFPRYFGETPIRDIGLLATEGRVSIPVEDGTRAGILDVVGAFFEFVDVQNEGAVHLCHELDPGKEYRVLMTTAAGFYRYDIGDHVLVHGYVGQAPVIEFLHRGARVSSLTGEKLTEWHVTAAFERCSKRLGLTMTDFVLAPVWDDPPFYRLYIDGSAACPNTLAARIDEELSHVNLEYRSKRSSGRLGTVRVEVLPPGTLAELEAAHRRRRGVANEQYKHQYLYTNPGDDESLLARKMHGERRAETAC